MNTFLPALRSGLLLRPFIGDLFAELDQETWPPLISADQGTVFRMDVAEYQDRYVIVADLPGRSTEDVDITLHNCHLTIEVRAQTEVQRSSEGDVKSILRERRIGAMKRTLQLPHTTSEKNIDATMKNGVLTVTIKKEEALKPKKIVVQ